MILAQTTHNTFIGGVAAVLIAVGTILVPAAIFAYSRIASGIQQAKQAAATAQAVTDVNTQRITNVSQHAVQIDGKLTDIAAQIPPQATPRVRVV